MRCDWVEGVSNHEQTFRRLAIRDDAFVDFLLGDESANLAASTLDAKTHALVRLGALVAIDAATPSYMEVIEAARPYGATDDELAGVLIAVIASVGAGRVVSAAPKLALALGYDVGGAFEDPNADEH